MSFIYLASPYTHEDQTVMQQRYEKVLDAAMHVATKGIVIYSPIVHFHPMALRHNMPRHKDFWERQNFGMLDKAFALAILTLPGWEESDGIKGEFQRAFSCGKHISYIDPVSLEWVAYKGGGDVSGTRV